MTKSKMEQRTDPKAAAQGTARPSSGASGRKTKKDQLITLLSKPNGARIAVISERLGWQAHTVRAALSGLRRAGFDIAATKSAKSGETVYAIVGQPASAKEAVPAGEPQADGTDHKATQDAEGQA